jgi:hypothetical protein
MLEMLFAPLVNHLGRALVSIGVTGHHYTPTIGVNVRPG